MKKMHPFSMKLGTPALLRAFQPAVTFMNKLRYLQKFLVIGAIFMIPILLLTVQVMSGLLRDIRSARLEMDGAALQRSFASLLVTMDEYGRTLDSEFVPGQGAEAAKKQQGSVDELWQQTAALNSRLSPPLVEPQALVAALGQWQTLSGGAQPPARSYYELQREELEQQVLRFMEGAARGSGLTADNNADSAHFIDYTTQIFPTYWTRLEKAESLGAEVAARKQVKNPEQQEILIRLTGETQALSDRTAVSAELLAAQRPDVMAPVNALLQAHQAAAKEVTYTLSEKLVNTGVIKLTPEEAVATAQQAKTATLALYNAETDLLNAQLDSRLSGYRTSLTLISLLVLVIIALASYVFVAFYIAVHRGIEQLSAASRRLVGGDLTARARYETKDEFNEIIAAFNNLADSFRNVVGKSRVVVERAYESSDHLQTTVKETTEGAQAISDIMSRVAAGSDVLAQSAAETSLAMSEVALGVQRIAITSSVVAEAAGVAADQARQGYDRVQETSRQMTSIKRKAGETAATINGLFDKASQIDRIVEVIRDIAEQTRLLALNASIEAARAGDHGRGFVVVATEVRKLADQSGESARQIAQLISGVQASFKDVAAKADEEIAEVDKGGRSLEQVVAVFESILSSVDRVAEQIQEVSAASEQISASAEEVTASMEDSVHISRNATAHTKDVAQSLEQQKNSSREAEASSSLLNQLSDELLRSLAKFRLE